MNSSQRSLSPAVKHPPPSASAQLQPRWSIAWSRSCEARRQTTRAVPTNVDTTSVAVEDEAVPWSINPYYTKQKYRSLGELGQILETPDSVEEPVGWTQDTKLKLSIQVVSQELGRPEEEVAQQLQLLRNLLPDLQQQLKPADLVRLAADLAETAEKLLILRDALPTANVSQVVSGNLSLLHMSKEQLHSNMQQVAALLSPHAAPAEWQALLEHSPFLTDSRQLRAALSEIARLFGRSLDDNYADTGVEGPAALLIRNPPLALCCQDLKPQGGNDTD